MPECCEVKVFGDQIRPLVVGKNLIKTTSSCKNHDLFSEVTNLRLSAKVLNVTTHGKSLSWELSNSHYINFSFGMSGSFALKTAKHNRIEFLFDDDSMVYYSDIRRFGRVTFQRDKPWRLGVDPFQAIFTPLKLSSILKTFDKRRLGEALLDQSGISGIGNYLRSQILYQAKLSPWRACDSLSEAEKLELYRCIKDVTADSYAAGGCTLATYRDVNGQSGGYASSLQVYKKKTDPLGNAVVRELDKTKRAMWWVPTIQR